MTASTFYVSTRGSDLWSGRLTRNIQEGSDGPFQTLHRAQEAVRAEISKGMTGDITVIIDQGIYYLNKSLTFGLQDSGGNGYRCIWRGVENAEVVINGGAAITGWQQFRDGIYRAAVPQDWSFDTCSENGIRSYLARHPNEGYLRVAEMNEDEPKRRFRFAEGDIPQIEDLSALRIYIWPGGINGEWNWFSNDIPVESIDYNTRTLRLARDACYELGAGSRYFIHGAPELLDQPGEFFLDRSKSFLYYLPRNMPIDSQEIVAPLVQNVIEFRGKCDEQPIENISIEGLAIGTSGIGGGCVLLENTRNITVGSCRIFNSGSHGVLVQGYAEDNTICGNLIHDIGDTGVQINGPPNTIRCMSKRIRIINNHVHHTGQVTRHGAGIQISQCGECVIAHNLVHDAPRYGISIKDIRPGVLIGRTIGGIEVTSDNAKDFIHTNNNIVEYNDVWRVNTDSQDTGLFEAWGVGIGNIIRNNRFHDSDIHFSFGFGIYLDDACDHFTVAENLLDGLQKTGAGTLEAPLMIKGVHNIVRNNVVADCNAKFCASFCEMGGEPNRHIYLEANIFRHAADSIYLFHNWDTNIHWDEDRIDHSERNLFWNASGKFGFGNVPGVASFDDWKRLLDGKYDQTSIVADPLFVDSATGDYRLRHDSPAYSLGFKDIDYAGIGLEDDFAFADSDDTLERIFVGIEGAPASWLRMDPGEAATLNLRARSRVGYVIPAEDLAVSYEVSDPAIATVDTTGTIRARETGMARVTATAERRGITRSTIFDIIVG